MPGHAQDTKSECTMAFGPTDKQLEKVEKDLGYNFRGASPNPASIAHGDNDFNVKHIVWQILILENMYFMQV